MKRNQEANKKHLELTKCQLFAMVILINSGNKDNKLHLISRKPFNDAIKQYPNCAKAIETTYKVLRKGDFHSPQELKSVFPSLDNFKYEDKWWVIDIGGNTLRLIAFIEFRDNRMYVKHIVNHAEYDKVCKQHAKRGN